MSTIYTYRKESTLLVELKHATREGEGGDQRSYAVQHNISIRRHNNRHFEFIERCEEYVKANAKVLGIARNLFSGANFLMSDPTSGVKSVFEMDSLWPNTAPLVPTAVISAAFSTLPLLAIVESPSSSSDTVVEVGGPAETYQFFYEFPHPHSVFFSSGVHSTNGTLHAASRIAWRCSRLSFWETFSLAATTVCFDGCDPFNGIEQQANSSCNASASMRFSLTQYMKRAKGSGSHNHSDKVLETSIAVWNEEMLWRLLSALISHLAVQHSRGLHYGGKLTTDDVVCFAVPPQLSAQIEDTANSFHRTLDKDIMCDAANLRLLVKTALTSVVLPQTFITSRTQSHRAFFVMPMPLTSIFSTSDYSSNSPTDQFSLQAADVVCVGRILLDVIEAQRKALGETLNSVSSEFLFLVKRMEEGSSSSSSATKNVSSPSALHLSQLQAFRLRATMWIYKAMAEESQLELHAITRSPQLKLDNASTKNAFMNFRDETPVSSAVVPSELEVREAKLREREEKLDAILELYELTHTHLDGLPASGAGGYEALRHSLVSSKAEKVIQPYRQQGHQRHVHRQSNVDAPVALATVTSGATGNSNAARKDDAFVRNGDRVLEDEVPRRDLLAEVERSALSQLGISPLAKTQDVSLIRDGEGTEGGDEDDISKPLPPPSHRDIRGGLMMERQEYGSLIQLQHTAGMITSVSTPPREHASRSEKINLSDRAMTGIAQEKGPAATTTVTATTATPSFLSQQQQQQQQQVVMAQDDKHTPKRPVVSSLGREDWSSHSKYSAISTGPHLRRSPSVLTAATTATAGAGAVASGRRSPRTRTNDEWIRNQFEALEELRENFKTATSASVAVGATVKGQRDASGGTPRNMGSDEIHPDGSRMASRRRSEGTRSARALAHQQHGSATAHAGGDASALYAPATTTESSSQGVATTEAAYSSPFFSLPSTQQVHVRYAAAAYHPTDANVVVMNPSEVESGTASIAGFSEVIPQGNRTNALWRGDAEGITPRHYSSDAYHPTLSISTGGKDGEEEINSAPYVPVWERPLTTEAVASVTAPSRSSVFPHSSTSVVSSPGRSNTAAAATAAAVGGYENARHLQDRHHQQQQQRRDYASHDTAASKALVSPRRSPNPRAMSGAASAAQAPGTFSYLSSSPPQDRWRQQQRHSTNTSTTSSSARRASAMISSATGSNNNNGGIGVVVSSVSTTAGHLRHSTTNYAVSESAQRHRQLEEELAGGTAQLRRQQQEQARATQHVTSASTTSRLSSATSARKSRVVSSASTSPRGVAGKTSSGTAAASTTAPSRPHVQRSSLDIIGKAYLDASSPSNISGAGVGGGSTSMSDAAARDLLRRLRNNVVLTS